MNAKSPALGRLMTAMVTPLAQSGAVDISEAQRLANWLIGEGNDGVVVCGTTGEGSALDDDEKVALFSAIAGAVGKRACVVAGVGSNNTRATVALAREAEDAGVDALLVVVPPYSKPTQDGMLRHFGAVAEATRLPLIVYNIPGRTCANMLPATLLELARRYPNVAGVKESSGDLTQITAILRDRAPDFIVWSGDDHLFLPTLSIGGDGLISVAAHLCARELRELYDAFTRGDVARAAALHRQVSPLVAALFSTTNPLAVKWAVREIGFSVGECRSPLGTLPEPLAASLNALLTPYRERAPIAVLPVR